MQGEILEQELSGIITKSIISMVPEEVPFWGIFKFWTRQLNSFSSYIKRIP